MLGVDELLAHGEALLARGDALDAVEIFAEVYSAAVSAGNPAVAARAMLGRAQAEFAMRRLAIAAEHAANAWESLTALGLPDARHAADLLVQIDHNRYLA